jgi:VWFA-related protein
LTGTFRYLLPKAFFVTFIGYASLYGQAAGNGQTTPSVKVTTRMVIVDVVARDKKGDAVTDLEAPDVRILEDGKEQPISSFVFQHPRQRSAVEADKPRAVQPANIFSNARKFSPDSALNVILLDSLNSNLLNQAYVRIEMIKFLEKLPPGQPVAIYTLGRKLRLIQDFTTDLAELKRVIAALNGQSSPLLQDPTGAVEVSMVPKGLAEQTLAEKDPKLLAQIKDFVEESTADQNDMRVQLTFAALTSLGRTLSRYKGRKNLIWVSESVPMNIFADFNTITRVNPNAGSDGKIQGQNTGHKTDRSNGDGLAHLANLLADAQIAVYPIDARGLIGSPLYNAASNITGQGGSAYGGMAMKAEGKQSEELFESHVAMLDIADKTGGKAYYNRNDIDNALGNGMEDGSTYYMVGYYPQNRDWNGKFRKIEVKTRRPGVKLRYRTGYFALDQSAYAAKHPEQRDLDFNQMLSLDSPIASTLQFEAEVTPPTGDSTTVLLRYAVDPQAIQFTLGPDGLQHATVDCAARAFARDDPDKPVKTAANEVRASLQPEAFARIKSSFFPCELKVELPAGQYLLRLAVRDGNGNTVGSANARVTVPVQPLTAQRKTDATR